MRLLKTTMTVLALTLSLMSGVANAGTFFEDAFDGSALDASKWNTDNTVAGVRFCPTDFVNHLTYGNWIDVSTVGCWGTYDDGWDYWEGQLFQPAPYGFVTVGAGLASFSSDYRYTFPFVFAGPPSRPSPFPAEGDFAFEIRMRYDFIGGHGTGVSVYYKADTTPAGSNSVTDVGVYGIWAGWSGFYGAGTTRSPYDAYAYQFHTFRLEYVGGYYSTSVDGVLVDGPTQSATRPNAVFIGNPVFTAWGVTDWSDFTIDYIRVTVPETPVQIDIKPGSFPNSINLGSGGVVPVAIFSTPSFNAATIDPLSVTLASAPVQLRGNGTAQASLQDVNSDGLLDLVVQVMTEALQLSDTDTEATLEGTTTVGTPIRGYDTVRIVP
jgi:hypothetical protein